MTYRCRTCREAVYFRGDRDGLGRPTSTGKWVHYGESSNPRGHDAIPTEEES